MGRFLLFFAVGVVAGATVDFLWGKNNGGFVLLGQPPQRHQGFIPLETPRATLPDASLYSASEARVAYLTRNQQGQGLGQIDFLLM
jgi:hypothetical protein